MTVFGYLAMFVLLFGSITVANIAEHFLFKRPIRRRLDNLERTIYDLACEFEDLESKLGLLRRLNPLLPK